MSLSVLMSSLPLWLCLLDSDCHQWHLLVAYFLEAVAIIPCRGEACGSLTHPSGVAANQGWVLGTTSPHLMFIFAPPEPFSALETIVG